MRFRRVWFLRFAGAALAVVCASGCKPSASDSTGDAGLPDAAIRGSSTEPSNPSLDRDGDGVCNVTEIDLRSDPDRADTDRDGLPDFTEFLASYSLTDPLDPGPEQVAYLPAEPPAAIDFEVRMTVVGSGLGYTGEFRTLDALDPRGLTARDFFVSAVALAGEPSDNVRGLQAESERFDSVLGKTRLSFQLHFEAADAKLADCAIGYPFEYRLKDDAGRFTSAQDYLLVIVPEAARITAAGAERPRFCVPTACL